MIDAIKQLVDFDGLEGALVNGAYRLILGKIATNREWGRGIGP